VQLEPALGSWAKQMFLWGLLAAGFSSAITAPVAAAYAASGCFGWSGKLSDFRLKLVASIVVFVGAFFAIQLGSSPKETIILAQVANGLLLPIIAISLLVLTNNAKLMGKFKNGRLANLMAVVVILIVSVIAFNQFRKVAQKLMPDPQTGQTTESFAADPIKASRLTQVAPSNRAQGLLRRASQLASCLDQKSSRPRQSHQRRYHPN